MDMYYKEIKAKLTFISKMSDGAVPTMLMLSMPGFSLLDRCQPKVLAFFCMLDRIHVSSAVFHCEDITCIALQAQLASANTFLLVTVTVF